MLMVSRITSVTPLFSVRKPQREFFPRSSLGQDEGLWDRMTSVLPKT